MNYRLTITALFLCIHCISNVYARSFEYDIELVIFEDATGKYINSEKWPSNNQIGTTDTDANVDYLLFTLDDKSSYPINNSVIKITENENTILKNKISRLNRSSKYNILLHKKWRQVGLDESSAVDIPIDNYTINTGNNIGLLQIIGLEDDSQQSGKNKKLKSNISGSVKIVLSRYLHFYSNLIYTRYNPDFSENDSGVFIEPKKYTLNFHRRMRSKRLHYIDHPLVGMLVIATPVEEIIEKQNETKEPADTES